MNRLTSTLHGIRNSLADDSQPTLHQPTVFNQQNNFSPTAATQPHLAPFQARPNLGVYPLLSKEELRKINEYIKNPYAWQDFPTSNGNFIVHMNNSGESKRWFLTPKAEHEYNLGIQKNPALNQDIRNFHLQKTLDINESIITGLLQPLQPRERADYIINHDGDVNQALKGILQVENERNLKEQPLRIDIGNTKYVLSHEEQTNQLYLQNVDKANNSRFMLNEHGELPTQQAQSQQNVLASPAAAAGPWGSSRYDEYVNRKGFIPLANLKQSQSQAGQQKNPSASSATAAAGGTQPSKRKLPYKEIIRSLQSAGRQALARMGRTVPVREPLENPQKNLKEITAEGGQARFSKIVPFEKFNANLQIAFGRALANIQKNSGEKNPPYIIVGDENPNSPKSTTWVTKLVSEQTAKFPPKKTILAGDIYKYLEDNKDVKNVIFIDDGSYSGKQLFYNISKPASSFSGVNFHIVVPYMTKKANERLQQSNSNGNVHLYAQERMLSYAELGEKHIAPEESEAELQTSTGKQQQRKDEIETRTPTWMAHKAADAISTNYEQMEKIASVQPISPYKEKPENVMTNWEKQTESKFDPPKLRQGQILKLENEIAKTGLQALIQQESDLSWLNGQLHFVKTNRGFFLVANKYVSDTQKEQLKLQVAQNPHQLLGGDTGEYQVKIKEGDQFFLQTTDGQHKAMLQLKSGKLVKLS